MTSASDLVLHRWVTSRLDPKHRRALVHRGMVCSSVCIVLCLAVIWATASQVESCQRLVDIGLTVTHNVESLIAVGGPQGPSPERQLARYFSQIQQTSEALQNRAGLASWLLPRSTSAAISDLARSHKQIESALRPGDYSLTLQPLQIQQKVHELGGAWLRVATSLTGATSGMQRTFLLATAAACLVLLLLAIAVVLYSDSTVRRAAILVEKMAVKISTGDVFRSDRLAGIRDLHELPGSLTGFSESFDLLARLLQGHCQIAVKVLDFFTPGVTILSGGLRILAANRPFCALVGGTPDSVQGKQLIDVFPDARPLLLGPVPQGQTRRGRDFMSAIKSTNGRLYRARFTEILPGDGDEGINVLMLADAEDTNQRAADRSEFRTLYEKIIESVSDAILLVERDGCLTDVSPLAARLVGYSREELVGTRLQALQQAPLTGSEESLDAYLTSPNWKLDGRVLKTKAVKKDGTVFSAEFSFTEFGAGGSTGYLVKMRDVSEKELEDSLARERLRVIELIARNQPLETVLSSVAELVEHQIDGSYCVILLKENDRLVPAVAPRLAKELVEALCGLPLNAVVSACTRSHMEGRAMLLSDVIGERVWEPFQDETLKRGLRSFLSVPIFSSEGLVVGLIAACRSEAEGPRRDQGEVLQLASQLACVCIEQRELTGRLAYKAQHDALTGLLNRLSFEERLRQALAQAARGSRSLAILSVDLDRFKLVNDTLGHAAGDELIKQVAGRLVSSLRETDLVARWGGDEFVIGLVEIADPGDAERVAAKLVDALSAPFDIAGHTSSISASIGVSIYPQHGADLDTLVRHADTAMYRAKRGGRNGFHRYDVALGEPDRQRLELETQLRRVMDRGELALHYQPQIELRSRKLVAVEALLRWNHSRYGLIMPSTFIPIAEESGAVVPIGEWVIREACKQVREFERAGFGQVRVAVNVSRAQFARPDFVEMVAGAVRDADIEPQFLELELTESLLMEPGDESAPRMAKLGALGIKMSIDDFGTGYSSLSYLQRLPIDHLKIDRTFVEELGASSRTPLLVESIVTLSASLGMLSIAEGVESHTQLDVLTATGCNLVQGYLFCKPLPVGQLLTQLRRHGASGRWQPKTAARLRRGPGMQVPTPARVIEIAECVSAG